MLDKMQFIFETVQSIRNNSQHEDKVEELCTTLMRQLKDLDCYEDTGDAEAWMTPKQKLQKRCNEATTQTERFHWSLALNSHTVNYEWPEWKRGLFGEHRKPTIEELLTPMSPERIEAVERTREYFKDCPYWETSVNYMKV